MADMADKLLLEVLADLHEHGAEAPWFLEARMGKDMLARLRNGRYLVQLDATPAGPLMVLGSMGRRALGLSPSYRSPPEAAADQYHRRRCLDALRAKEWTYQGRLRRDLLRLHGSSGETAYLLARWRHYPARSVRRVLNRVRERLLREEAVLLVQTDRPHRLARLVERSDGLVRSLHDELWTR